MDATTENRLLFRAIENIPAGVLVYHRDGTILYMNPRGLDILNIAPNEYKELSVITLFGGYPHELPPPQPQKESGWVKPEDKQEAPSMEIELSTKWGKCHVGFRIQPFPLEEELDEEYFLMLFQDITQVTRLREERDRYLRMASMSKLLPTLAHEIKNPLAGIQSMVEVLREEVSDEQHAEELEVILDELERLRFLVDRMRLADAHFWELGQQTELLDVIHRTLKPMRRRAQYLGISLISQGEGALRVRLHPEMVRMVLINLINNSLEACTRGDRVIVSVQVIERELFLTVSDTGRGMSAEVLKRANELFFSTRQGGSGIGLALIQEVVDRSGGALRLWSEEGRGTRVTVSIPISID